MPRIIPKLGTLATPEWGATDYSVSLNMPVMGNRLKELREARGWTHEAAALKMGISRSGYVKIERGERRLAEQHIQAASRVFNVTPAEIMGPGDVVQLMGYVGAAQAVYQFDEGGAGEVEAPPGATAQTVAVEVRGESMLPLYEDGTLLFYSKQLAPDAMVGKRCVVRLEDERVLVKTLRRGSQQGLYSLLSLNAPDIDDVAVQWAAPIDWIKPRS